MGSIKRYDVSGVDQGNGVPFPAGTVLKLDEAGAAQLGLKRSQLATRNGSGPSEPVEPEPDNEGEAGDKKRPAPTGGGRRRV